MHLYSVLVRIAATLRALTIGAIVFLFALAIGIGVDAWVVNRAGQPPGGPVVHVRHYVLPLGGFVVMVTIVLRLALPAGGRASRHFLYHGPMGETFRYAACCDCLAARRRSRF